MARGRRRPRVGLGGQRIDAQGPFLHQPTLHLKSRTGVTLLCVTSLLSKVVRTFN